MTIELFCVPARRDNFFFGRYDVSVIDFGQLHHFKIQQHQHRDFLEFKYFPPVIGIFFNRSHATLIMDVYVFVLCKNAKVFVRDCHLTENVKSELHVTSISQL